MASKWFKALKKWRKYLILLFTPILLSPLPLALQDKVRIVIAFNMGYCYRLLFMSELAENIFQTLWSGVGSVVESILH